VRADTLGMSRKKSPSGGLAPLAQHAQPDDVRFYWNWVGRRRWGVAAVVVLLVGVPVAVVVASPIAWFLLAGAAWPTVSTWLFWRLGGIGVGETRFGLYWRAGGEGQLFFRGNLAWDEIRSFEYIEVPLHRDRIVVTLVDGSARDVWGARPEMRWRGGQTDDFAATLMERARHFGAPIEDD
jgi:hypothetical protein